MDRIKPDVIFIQETMVSGVKASNFFLGIKKDWVVVFVDVVGLPWCLLAVWDPRKIKLKAFSISAGILFSGQPSEYLRSLSFKGTVLEQYCG